MLHIVNKSPLGSSALDQCLRLCGSDDTLLLIEDGVYAATKALAEPLLRSAATVRVLREDVDARGLGPHLDARFEQVDYAGFVQLCCDHTPVQSWY